MDFTDLFCGIGAIRVNLRFRSLHETLNHRLTLINKDFTDLFCDSKKLHKKKISLAYKDDKRDLNHRLTLIGGIAQICPAKSKQSEKICGSEASKRR